MRVDSNSFGVTASGYQEPGLDPVHFQAESLISASSRSGVIDAESLATATYQRPLSQLNEADALRDAIARHLSEQDRETYLSAAQLARPYAIADGGASFQRPAPLLTRDHLQRAPISDRPEFRRDPPPAANDNRPSSNPLRPIGRLWPLLLASPPPVTDTRMIPGTNDLVLVQVRVSNEDSGVVDAFFARIDPNQEPGWFGPQRTRLDVPVKIQDGQVRYDPEALLRAYGRPVPGWTQDSNPTHAPTEPVPGVQDPRLAPTVHERQRVDPTVQPPGLVPGNLTPEDGDEQALIDVLRHAGVHPTAIAVELERLRAERRDDPTISRPVADAGSGGARYRQTLIEALRESGATSEQVEQALRNDWAERRADATTVNPRNQPGDARASGPLNRIEGTWLRGTQGNAGQFPAQVAEKLAGRQFENFGEFRAAFWRAVADTPELAAQFSPGNRALMREGGAPIAVEDQWHGGNRYVLHHQMPVARGGGVYDMSNLVVLTPRMHQDILARGYHFGR